MQDPEPFLLFTRELNRLGIRHMISDSIAAIFYGEPRMTNDVDIVVHLQDTVLPGIIAAFPLETFYCPPLEVMRTEISGSHRGHFNIIHHKSGFKADIYPSKDELHRWGLARSITVDFEGDSITLAPPEYVIVRKLEFYREGGSQKHLRDIHRMIAAMGNDWNESILLELIQDRQLSDEWALAIAFHE